MHCRYNCEPAGHRHHAGTGRAARQTSKLCPRFHCQCPSPTSTHPPESTIATSIRAQDTCRYLRPSSSAIFGYLRPSGIFRALLSRGRASIGGAAGRAQGRHAPTLHSGSGGAGRGRAARQEKHDPAPPDASGSAFSGVPTGRGPARPARLGYVLRPRWLPTHSPAGS